jgi:tetratricopeptide (TPR) repeat protein
MKKLVGFLFFVWLFLLLTGTSQIASAQNYYKMGIHAYYISDDSAGEAIRLFTRAIENKQETAKSYLMRGAAKMLLRQYEAALDDINTSRSFDQSNPRLYYYYGQVYLREGRNYLALHYFDTAISKDAKDPTFYNARAVAWTFLTEFDKVVENENMAIALDTLNDYYLVTRGFALIRLNQLNKAIEDLNRALKINESQKAFADRGYAFAQLGKNEEAIGDYSKSLKFNSSDGQVLCLRGISYLALGKKQLACEDFKNSAELNYAPAVDELKKNCN